MRLTLALLLPLACFANYPSQQSVILDAGATRVILTDSASGTSQTLIYGPGSGHRLRLTFSPINVPPPSGTSYSACADPCAITMARNWGVQHQFEELTNNSGTPLNSVGPHHSTLPMIEPAADAAGAWTFPIEVIGQDYFVKRVQVTNPGATVTGLRMYMRVNNSQCGIVPHDSKISVQVNGGAATANDGNWISVNNAAVTQLDESKYYGIWNSADPSAAVDYTTVAVPNGSIAGVPDTIEVAVAIPDNLATTGTNTIGFRTYCPDGKTSGYRILGLNFQKTSTVKTITQIAVSSNVATATTSGAHGYSSNDYIFISGAPGIHGRFNGPRQITVTDSTHFTFTPCGTNPNLLNCTSPNGTYTAPTSQAPTLSYATQPLIQGVKDVLADPVATWDDPSTWTAPSGGNAGTGATLWAAQNSLVNPNLGYTNNAITASCADCHTVSGMDLKYFAFSNSSIEQRALFHGLTFQNAKDIAAFIRGVTATRPSNSWPWTPLYGPCPTVDSQTINAWSAGGGIDCVLTYGNDAREYMAPSGVYTTWDPTSRLNTHNLPLHFQMPTWNQSLPAIHPADYAPGSNFFSNQVYTNYTAFRAAVTPGNYTTYASFGGPPINFLYLHNYLITLQIANNPGIDNVPGFIYPSAYMPGVASILQWASAKQWETMHEYQVEAMCPQIYTTTYGAAVGAAGYTDRCWQVQIPFNIAFHKTFQGSKHNPIDDSITSHVYQSNVAYVWQAILNSGNLRQTGDNPMDIAYTWGYLTDASSPRPSDWLLELQTIITAQSSWDQPLVDTGLGSFAYAGIGDFFPLGFGARWGLSFTSSADIGAFFNHVADNWASVISGKGNTAAWIAWNTAVAQNCTTGATAAYNSSGTYCDALALNLPLLVNFGVTSSKIDTIQTWAAAVWTTHNFAYDRSSAASGVVNITGGNTATWVSGDDFTNFGVDGSGSPAVRSYLYIGSTAYPITAVATNHSLTLSGSPSNGNGQSYTRCSAINPGGVGPTWPKCGNVQ